MLAYSLAALAYPFKIYLYGILIDRILNIEHFQELRKKKTCRLKFLAAANYISNGEEAKVTRASPSSLHALQ